MPKGTGRPYKTYANKAHCRMCRRPILWLSVKGKWLPQEESGGPHNCSKRMYYCKYCGARIIWKYTYGPSEYHNVLPHSPITLKVHTCKERFRTLDPPTLHKLPKEAQIDGISALLYKKPDPES